MIIYMTLAAQGMPFFYLLSSVHHYGAFLCMLLFLALWFRYMRIVEEETGNQQKQHRALAIVSLFAFLFALSDHAFFVQTLVPFVAACFLANLRQGKKSLGSYGLPLLPLMFGVASLGAYSLILADEVRVSASHGIGLNAEDVAGVVWFSWEVMRNIPAYGMFFLGYFASLVIAFFFADKIPKAFRKNLLWFLWFSMFSALVNMCAIVLNEFIVYMPRYMLPAFFLPVMVAVLTIFCCVGKRLLSLAAISLGAAFSAKLLWLSFLAVQQRGLRMDYYPEQVRCIDRILEEEGLSHGIAQYWSAKNIQGFSRQGVVLAQYIHNQEYRHITSSRFFRDRYDFAIFFREPVQNPELTHARIVFPETLEQINGAPEMVFSCGNKDIHVYGKNRLRYHKIVDPGDFWVWDGCKGKNFPKHEMPYTACAYMDMEVVNAIGQRIILTYPEVLPTGDYAFELEYSSAEAETEIFGKWEVWSDVGRYWYHASKGHRLIQVGGILYGTGGRKKDISGEFFIKKIDDKQTSTIHLTTWEHADFQVHGIRIERIR